MSLFNRLPGHERNYTPLSEYLFKTLQPMVDDLLFLGGDYEASFDEFEILFALTSADMRYQRGVQVWGPVGRFGWKRVRRSAAYTRLLSVAESEGENWGPLRAGLFGGDYSRFQSVSDAYTREVVSLLRWH